MSESNAGEKCQIRRESLGTLKQCIESIYRRSVVCPDTQSAYGTAMGIIKAAEEK